ncbi:Fic family protein [Cellulomonas sp. Sa3CUA2]|uniref:Fic family protein n=1 Tax=Cellulomonas avistercoris TaxID=2762242 RepID=A0ABR8QF08_9CELL|nr:Fic family protein [Cellulomonas avistercoris]MBD7919016.1 Fic family protein [Cellulomonas avistercoris]
MIYLTAEELLVVARRVVGNLVVRDIGLVESAAARPRTQIAGADAYPDLLTKAAALLHSLTRNHALLDGDERLALAGTIVFLGVNGTRLVATNDDAYDLIMDVAAGRVDDVESIRERLARLTEAW